MKTFLTLLLAIVPLVSFAQPVRRNPMTTNQFMNNLPSNLQVPAWNTAAGRWSNSTVSAGGSAQVWTNEADFVRLVGGSSNSMKVMTDGLFGIAIGDTNALNAGGWPMEGATYMSFIDGSSGHKLNKWRHGIFGIDAGDYATAQVQATSDPAASSFSTEVQTAAAEIATVVIENRGYDAFLTLKDENENSSINFQAGGDTFGEGVMVLMDWKGQPRLLLHTNGTLTVGDAPPSDGGYNSGYKLAVGDDLVTGGSTNGGLYVGSFHGDENKQWAFKVRTATNLVSLQLLVGPESSESYYRITYLEPTAAADTTAYHFDTAEDHTSGHLLEVLNFTESKFAVTWDGALTIASTTNHITFGATNAPPANPTTPSKWISVLINGEATQYKIPLYQ